MGDALSGEITKHLPNTTVGANCVRPQVFKERPTDKQYLIRRKQRDNPDRFFKTSVGAVCSLI